jgi:uncharacterized protein YecT (DUF1311 family)
MVAFANGWGVPVNRKRATAFTCRSGELSHAEWEDTVGFLASPENAAKPYLFCDHTTSGAHGGQCAAFDEDKVQVARDRKLAQLEAGFTPAQNAAFASLQKTSEAYIDSHARDEQDMSGTLRGAFYVEESSSLHEVFLKALEDFEHGKLPSKDDLAEADKTLNATYREILTATDWSSTGTVAPEGLRKTERLWLRYRDAWAAFGIARYPSTRADDWKAWATRARIATLKAGFRPFE